MCLKNSCNALVQDIDHDNINVYVDVANHNLVVIALDERDWSKGDE